MTDNDLEKLSNEDDGQGGTVVSKTPDEAKADVVEEEAKGVEPPESNEGRLSGRAADYTHDSKPKKNQHK